MKYRDRVRLIAPSVPTASMADIAFLLIIFFMLTTSFSPDRTNVKLPQSAIQMDISDEAAIVAITAEGLISFTSGDEPSVQISGPDELGSLARDIIAVIPDKEFIVKADRETRYESIDKVLDALRKSGAKRIGLLTRPRQPENP